MPAGADDKSEPRISDVPTANNSPLEDKRARVRRTLVSTTVAPHAVSHRDVWQLSAPISRFPFLSQFFPNTDFPRVVIGVDNGVTPIDQMLVTITRPLEEAVNSVPGLQKVYSTTSRGSAEVNLFFDWNVDMFQTLQRVDSVVARVQSELPPTAKIETHRLTFATFPILGYSLTSDSVSQDKFWEIATYDLKPRLNRLDGVASILMQGGRVPEFHVIPDPAKLLVSRHHRHGHSRGDSPHQLDRFSGACSKAIISWFSDWSAARFTPRQKFPASW